MPSDSPPEQITTNLPVKRGRGRPRGTYGKTYVGKFRAAEIREALIRNFANVTMATAALLQAEAAAGGTRTIHSATVRDHLERWVKAGDTEVTESARKNLLDFAEAKVVNAIRNNDTRTARWILEQLGAERGYGRSGNPVMGDLMVIDPSQLTEEQLRTIFDPTRLSDRQMDIVLDVLTSRIGSKAGPIIEGDKVTDAEAVDVPEPPPAEAEPAPIVRGNGHVDEGKFE